MTKDGVKLERFPGYPSGVEVGTGGYPRLVPGLDPALMYPHLVVSLNHSSLPLSRSHSLIVFRSRFLASFVSHSLSQSRSLSFSLSLNLALSQFHFLSQSRSCVVSLALAVTLARNGSPQGPVSPMGNPRPRLQIVGAGMGINTPTVAGMENFRPRCQLYSWNSIKKKSLLIRRLEMI